MTEWIDRAAALARLGLKPQTLYAYVSRGLVGMRPDPADPRRSLYRVDDIEGLRLRAGRGRGRAAVASGTMAWGEPTLETAISTVHHGQLFYRGHDAATLANTATWEEVAALLWDGGEPVTLAPADTPDEPFAALAALVPGGYPTPGRAKARLLGDAQAAIGALASALGANASPAPLHERLARGWKVPTLADPLRRALVLLADHELNPSSFTVRVAASTGASIAAALLAGLSALSGPRHGTAGIDALLLLRDAERRGAQAAVVRCLGNGGPLPGFGHPLYPSGDPRAAALLAALPAQAPFADVCREALDTTGAHPNVDFALAVLTLVGNLPDDTSFRLFALARSAGWIAQAIEQVERGGLIRPRARYLGVLPR